MKKVYRYENNRDYWDRRWATSGHDANQFTRLDIYPIKYAQMVMTDPSRRALELGAGLGRILKHYHYSGYPITGLESSAVAVARLKSEDPSLDIALGDVRSLAYQNEEFEVVLSFGLYHNIEEGLDKALRETARCLKRGGRFCISMRPNNIDMKINEWYWLWRHRKQRFQGRTFHKWFVREQEFREMLSEYGLDTDRVHRARNVSLLYRLPWLRAWSLSETERRSEGYRLNVIGRAVDRTLVTVAPAQFCNVLVYVGHKR